jgi:hypothetical protein
MDRLGCWAAYDASMVLASLSAASCALNAAAPAAGFSI